MEFGEWVGDSRGQAAREKKLMETFDFNMAPSQQGTLCPHLWGLNDLEDVFQPK